ncbi:hypothetical protein AMK19_30860 [Kitasatospora sp. CB01950]|nr:hypothetical protein AMK19_30860 [Kitasatospora sp. CB01950]
MQRVGDACVKPVDEQDRRMVGLGWKSPAGGQCEQRAAQAAACGGQAAVVERVVRGLDEARLIRVGWDVRGGLPPGVPVGRRWRERCADGTAGAIQGVHVVVRQEGQGGGERGREGSMAQQGQVDPGEFPQGEEVLEVAGADAVGAGDDDVPDVQGSGPGGDNAPGGVGSTGPVGGLLVSREQVLVQTAQEVVGQGCGGGGHGGGVDGDAAQRRGVGGQGRRHEGVVVVCIVHHGERGQIRITWSR